MQTREQLSTSDNLDGVSGSFVGIRDRLHGTAELRWIQMVGEQIHVFADPIDQAVRFESVSTGEGESETTYCGESDARQLAVLRVHGYPVAG